MRSQDCPFLPCHHLLLALGFLSLALSPRLCLASTALVSDLICAPQCGNLGQLHYPFGPLSSSLCGYPYLKMNCTGQNATWHFHNLTYPTLGISRFPPGQETGYLIISPDANMSTCDAAVPLPANTSFLPTFITNMLKESISIATTSHFVLFGCNMTGFNFSHSNFSGLECSGLQNAIPNCPHINSTSNCFETSNSSQIKDIAPHCKYYTAYDQDPEQNSSQIGVKINWKLKDITYCPGCLKTNGTCGYLDKTDNFVCYCPNGEKEVLNCTASAVSKACTSWTKCETKATVLGVLLCLIGLLILILVWLMIRMAARRREQIAQFKVRSLEQLVRESSNKEFVHAFAGQVGPVPTQVFSYKELLHATKSFAEGQILGDGGCGTVYEGRLYDGRKVAVKRLYHDNYRRTEQFVTEIRILSSLVHPNLIKLYGFCYEERHELLLVYEYVNNGTLAEHLHGPLGSQQWLQWEDRLRIAYETARALAYLHASVNPPIFHRDVKSTNILLDERLRVRVADFGLSRLVPLEASHVSTAPQGTPGYLDPDYHQSYQLTDKSDVYSFGVVLMEIISGKLPVDMARDRGDINLSHLAVSKIQSGQLYELVDPYLEIDQHPSVANMVMRVAELGHNCLAAEKDDRPNMTEVAAELRRIWDLGYDYEPEPAQSPTIPTPESEDSSELMTMATSKKKKKNWGEISTPRSVHSKWWSISSWNSSESWASASHNPKSLPKSTET